MEEAGVEWLSPTDADARLMKCKSGFMPAYNIQSTVDNGYHFITTFEVTNYQNDYYSFALPSFLLLFCLIKKVKEKSSRNENKRKNHFPLDN